MTNILSLFRRKTTYIYTIILTVIITVIIMFYSFYNYFNDVFNAHFLNSGLTYIISHEDYTDEIKKYSDIESITDMVLLKPNFDDEFMGFSSFVLNGVEQDDSGEEYHRLFNWNDILINEDYIQVFEYDENLKENEVIFLQFSNSKTDEEIEEIKDNEFTVYSNDELITLKIKNIEESYYDGMKISKELYEELLKKQTIYAKLIKFSNYNTSLKMQKDFSKRETNIDYDVSSFISYKDNDADKLAGECKNLIYSCNTASIFLIIAFIIIFVIVVKNSLLDQKGNIKMQRFLGYKKINIKLGLIGNFIIMSILAYIISYILSAILIIVSNNILNYTVHIIDLLFLVELAGVTTLSSIVLILLFNINKEPNEEI